MAAGMGQTSSQLESTQVKQGVNVQEAASSSTESRTSTPQAMATHLSSGKHARTRSASEDVAASPAKKLKTAHKRETKQKHHRVGRSVPQHMRGLDIRPSQTTSILRDVDPAASHNIQRPVSPGNHGSDNDEASLDDNIVVSQSRRKNSKRPVSVKSASSDSCPSENPVDKFHDKQTFSQSVPAERAPEAAEVVQRARQKLAVDRGQEALAQDPAWGERFTKEQDTEVKKGMLMEFIEQHALDPILMSMFFKDQQRQQEAENEGDEDDSVVDTDDDEMPQDVVKDTQETTATSAAAIGMPTPSTLSQPQHATAEGDVPEAASEVVFNDDPNVEGATDPYYLEYPEKAKRVSNWLLQPEEPAEPATELLKSESPEVVVERPKKPSQRKKTAARKSAEMVVDSDAEQQEAAGVDDEDDVSEVEVQPKKKRKTAQRKKAVARKSAARIDHSDDERSEAVESDGGEAESDSEVKDEESEEKAKEKLRGTTKGTWTAAEIAKAEAVFNSTCNQYRLTGWELCRKMTDWEGELPSSFKTQIYAAFPLRTRKAIRGFCQRRWHDNNTGPWSEEEDRLLREAYKAYPGNWIEIGCMIGGGRTAPSCRDRWLDHLQYEGKLNKGPWTKEEEDELRICVEKQVGGDQGRKIDWKRVVEDMDFKRGARKCMVKWKAMRKRQIPTNEAKGEHDVEVDEEDEDMLLQNSIMAQMEPEPEQATARQGHSQPLSKHLKALESKYRKLGWGDVCDALGEIDSVFTVAELDIVYEHESTFWSLVSVRLNKRNGSDEESKFKSFPKLRRRCYLGALERFGDEEIEAYKGMARRADLLMEKIIDLHDEGEIEGPWRLENKIREEQARRRVRGTGVGWLEAGARNAPGSSPPPYLHNGDEGDDLVIPETQLDDTAAGADAQYTYASEDEEAGDIIEVVTATPNTSRSGTPVLALREFLQKCANTEMTELPGRPTDRPGESAVEMRSVGGRIYKFNGGREELEERIREWRDEEDSEGEESDDEETREAWRERRAEFEYR